MKTIRCILAVFALLAAGSALPAQITPAPRAIDFNQSLTGYDGKPLMEGDPAHGVPLAPVTLGEIARLSLEANLDADRSETSGKPKDEREAIVRKLFSLKEQKYASVALTVEEIAMLKERIGKAMPTVYVYPAWHLLDPTEK